MIMKNFANRTKNKPGFLLVLMMIQDELSKNDPEDNKNKNDNSPSFENPFYDPDSDQGGQEYNEKEDPRKDDNEPIGEDYPLKDVDEEEEEEDDEDYDDDMFDDDELNNSDNGDQELF